MQQKTLEDKVEHAKEIVEAVDATARKLVDNGYTYPFDEISNNSV